MKALKVDELTSISLTKGDRAWLRSLGKKGESYHDIIQKLREKLGDRF